MTRDEAVERVYKIIFENVIDCKYSQKTFTPHLNLASDLNLDQLSLIEIAKDIQTDFGISFGYMEMSGWRTILDVIVTVSSNTAIDK